MDSAKAQLADKLKSSNNILVTVSRNPSVDQLSALLGLTLALNKSGKHAAAVFSGEVPSTLEFLQPEATIEKDTNSLRDFIIALDKNKADKLRYKVEDDVVRIFITPYKTSLSDADLEFSQGDFNVDVVVAIGVQQQEDLDQAITAHGRILHDATVTSINLSNASEGLGSINWNENQSSSLSEMVTELIQNIDGKLLDGQIATSLLTGIVAETARFSNDKTSSQTMSASAALMAAGANQQLIATKLDEPVAEKVWHDDDQSNDDDPDARPESKENNDQPPKPDDGTIEIAHNEFPEEDKEPLLELPAPEQEAEPQVEPKVEVEEPQNEMLSGGSRLIVEPPTLGGTLTANSTPEELDPANDALGFSQGSQDQLLSRSDPAIMSPAPEQPEVSEEVVEKPVEETEEKPAEEPVEKPVEEPEKEQVPEFVPAPVAEPLPAEPVQADPTPEEQPGPGIQPASEPTPEPSLEKTLADLEKTVAETAAQSTEKPADLTDARDEVSKALSSEDAADPAPTPIAALNAQPFGESLHANDEQKSDPAFIGPSVEDILNPKVTDPTAPPPVPPPIPFNFNAPQ